jgi:hypothetical protein
MTNGGMRGAFRGHDQWGCAAELVETAGGGALPLTDKRRIHL